jgi:hypothetical protein
MSAYFSLEIGVDPQVRTYAGGLGVLLATSCALRRCAQGHRAMPRGVRGSARP